MTMLWSVILLVVAVYCLVQIVRDFRARNYPMAVFGCICLGLLLLMPIQADAFKLDLLL